jgi:hypothetical protein
MKIEIPFEIGDKVWFIHPKTMKATNCMLKGLKTETEVSSTSLKAETKIKYQIDTLPLKNEEKFYVWNVFKTKEELLKSL